MSSNNIFHNHLLNLIERKRLCADDTLQAMNAAGVNDDRGDSFSSPMVPRPWQDAADFINLQSDPMVRERVASLFGLAIRHE